MRQGKIAAAMIASALCSAACAHDGSSGHAAASPAHTGGIKTEPTASVLAPFDIIHAKIKTKGNVAIFHMAVSGKAGASKPNATGKFEGSDVFSYVWPTTIDSYEVGFEKGAGILALAVTSHPDFDDTPLFDENGDNDAGNDGGLWHMHWVVLGPDKKCGEGALKVQDIAPGTSPRLPKTWPGVPILLDSPGWQPSMSDNTVEVRVPFDDISVVNKSTFDGVTAGLRINASAHAPLLCVTDVFKVSSGDLSLPGIPNR